ncbi:acetyltransferase GNAT family [Methanobrevibacter millerae]|uniref:Acetyltransferase GNAT family n=2 Tax=Methanobrevibacter millerae TaxID=230361 RepID=A0A0U3EAY6_9EURY|nr:acetyltransferase GNAT family [Methanobrevibacter millerae]
MMEWKLKKFDDLTSDELYGILKLRSEVFVVEQDCVYQDLDDKDQLSYHLFLENDGETVAVSRFIPENVSYEEMSIGRVVVKENFRGQGLSKIMMKKAIDFIVDDLGKSEIRLSGQAYLVDFYENLGFKKVSDVYMEDNIEHFEFLYCDGE